MRYAVLAAFAAPAALLFVAAGPARGDPPAPAAKQPREVHEKSVVVPAAEKARRNPYAGQDASIRNGAKLFASQCVMCHGIAGDGKGELAVRHGFDMPDFTDPAWQAGHTDGECFYILTRGCRRMSGQGDRLSEEWRWDLVNYVRSLKKKGS